MVPPCGGAACPTRLVVGEKVTHSLHGLADPAGRTPPCTAVHAHSDTGESAVCAPTFPAWSLLRLRPTLDHVHLSGVLPPGLREHPEITWHEDPQPACRGPAPGAPGCVLGAVLPPLSFLVLGLGT